MARDRDEEDDRCMQSVLGEGARDGNDSCSNLAHRNRKREVVGGAPQMLTNGADVNARNKEGVTALMSAANDPRRVQILEVLLESRAAVNVKDSSGSPVGM